VRCWVIELHPFVSADEGITGIRQFLGSSLGAFVLSVQQKLIRHPALAGRGAILLPATQRFLGSTQDSRPLG